MFRPFSSVGIPRRNEFKSSQLDNKSLLTFLGKNPNAVAAKYPELIEPARVKRSAIKATAITECVFD
jgi:hypothetical protein